MSKMVDDIVKAIEALIEVRETNLGIEATIPVAYAGGDLVEVVIEQAGKELSVHDSGFGFMRVTRSGLAQSRSLIKHCKELAARFDCAFSNARVTKLATIDTIGVAAALVANASRAIADQALEPRRHSEYDFRREVISRVREFVGDRIRENQELKGDSGRSYRVSAIVLDRALEMPQHIVGALASRSVVPNYFAEFYDLKQAFPQVKTEAVYDDTADFREEDRSLLSRVATPIAVTQAAVKMGGIFADEVAH